VTVLRSIGATLAVLAAVLFFPLVLHSDTILGNDALPLDGSHLRLKLVRELPMPGFTSGVTWSPDGSKLAAYSYAPGGGIPGLFYVPNPYGNVIEIWNSDGQLVCEIRRPYSYIDLGDTFGFAEGGTRMVIPPVDGPDDLAFSIVDIGTGEVIQQVAGPRPGAGRFVNAATQLAISSDQSIVAVAFGRRLLLPLALYSTRDGSKIGDLSEPPKNQAERPTLLAVSNDGKFLAVARTDRVVLIYDLSSRRVIQRIKTLTDAEAVPDLITFSPSGNAIAVGATQMEGATAIPSTNFKAYKTYKTYKAKSIVSIYRIADASSVANFEDPVIRLNGLSWTADGRFLAFITGNRQLHVWGPLDAEPSDQVTKLDRAAESLAFSPDGRSLAIGIGEKLTTFSVEYPQGGQTGSISTGGNIQ
jgi:WD40 repeat protein